MDNNIRNIKKELRSFAKRCKNIKFNEGLLLAFLMTGMLAFTKNTSVSEGIDATKQEISTSISDLKAVFREAKRENNKLLKDSNLELIQLMEQGDQVVKSPWSSWQFGMNYYYSGWNGVYKGMGDKAEKYPYEGVYTRSSDLFLRSISPYSRNYSRYTTSVSAAEKATVNSATTSISGLTDPSWGIESSVFDQEPILTLNLLATIKPKEINKVVPTVALGNIEGPGDVSFSITPPTVNIENPAITKLQFKHISPTAIAMNAHGDNNMSASSTCDFLETSTTCDAYHLTGERYTYTGTATGPARNLISSDLGGVDDSVPGVKPGGTQLNYERVPAIIKSNNLLHTKDHWFKIYFDSNGGNTNINTSFVIDNVRESEEYNSSTTDFYNNQIQSQTGTLPAHTVTAKPSFLSGVSRGASLDGAGTLNLNTGQTINLAGPFVVGLEQQTGTGSREIKNSGTITDEVENTHYRGTEGLGGLEVAVNVNGTLYKVGDTNGASSYMGANDTRITTSVKNIDNATGGTTITRTTDSGRIDSGTGRVVSDYDGGYIGHKVGLMLIEEDGQNSGDIAKLTNSGTITFNGGNSTGMLVNASTTVAKKVEVINNSGASINMNGGSSTGMKIASLITADSAMTNSGTIDIKGGSSNGMSVVDTRAHTGIVSNAGTINVHPLSGNSTGMLLVTNNADDITNKGTINLYGSKNTGMWVEGTSSPKALSTGSNAKINVYGTNNIGMLANNGGFAKNESSSTIALTGSNNVGMMANKDTSGTLAKVENTAIITSTGNYNVGIQVNQGAEGYNGRTASAGPPAIPAAAGTITLNGSNTTGVYNKGTFKMEESGSKITVDGADSIAVYASGFSSTTEINNGTVTIKGSTTDPLNAVGLYVADSAKIKITGDGSTDRLVANSGALMFYNYANDTSAPTGSFLLSGSDVKAKVNSGALAFHLRGSSANPISTVTHINNTLNDMFNLSIGTTKLDITLASGASLFEIKNDGLAAAGSTIATSELGVTPLTFGGGRIVVNGTNTASKLLKIKGGSLEIDSGPVIDLDTANNILNRVEFESSNVKVNSGITIRSIQNDKYGIRQKDTLTNPTTTLTPVLTVENSGTISLTGNKSRAIVVEFGNATNNNEIKVGTEGIGIYGADNSIITNSSNAKIDIGSKGVGIIGANDLTTESNSSRKINITNAGKITATDTTGEKTIGIYVDNIVSSLTPSTDSVIDHQSTGIIDLSNSKGSLGIHAGRTLLKSDGIVTVGDESAGIRGDDALIEINNASAEIKIGNKSIGVILENFGRSTVGSSVGYFDGRNGKININGTGSVAYYVDDSILNSGTSGNQYFNDNLTITDNGNSYTYIFAKNGSILNYDSSLTSAGATPKQIQTDNSVFINALDSTVNLGTGNKIESSKNNVIGVYLKDATGKSATNKGTITLTGDKSVALYGEGGGKLENAASAGIISVGQDSVGMYNKGTTTAVNNGEITLTGNKGIGMRSDSASGTSTNTGKIISTNLRAVGMSASGGSNALENTGEINLSGQESIGIHTDNLGTGHEITNGSSGKIILTDATDETKPNIGIYSDNAGDVIKNNGEITAGDQTIGVYSKAGGNVTLGGLSKTTVGQNAMGVYTTGGTVTIHDGAAITVGDRISAGKESVGVFYAGSNGTINNSTANITIGEGSIGFVMKGGSGNTLTSDNPSNGTVTLKKESVFIYDDTQSTVNNRTHLVSSVATDERIYGIYTNGKGSNYGNIDFSLGKGNVGIYSYLYDPNYTNNVNEKGEYIAQNKPGAFVNHGIISVSESDITPPNLEDKKYGIGMAAGYVKQRLVYNSTTNQTEVKRDVLGLGHIENYGTIRVTTPNSIGMYAGGKGSKAINHVNGRIELSGTELNVGMFLEDGAEGHNYGTITTVGSGNKEQVGIAVLREATFHNHPEGKVYINAEDGIGIAIGGRVTLVNRGEFVISADQKTATINGNSEAVKADGDGAVAIAVISDGSKIMGISPVNQVGIIHNDGTYDATITYNGVPVPYVQTVDAISSLNPGTGTIQTSSIGLYMDTSGVNATKPVNGIGNLATGMGLKYVDLIVGTEATEHTNEKYLKLSEDLINPYNNMILEAQTHGLRRWQIYSNSLTWMAKAEQNTDTQLIENMYLVKVPYTVWSGQLSSPVNSSDTYNFLDGLDQRYGVEALGTREREVFTKLNSIGNNEHILLSQAFDEMMGHQYGNTQQRMMATGSILDKEFTHLKKEWETKSKESNKIKTFGSRGEYKSNTAGIIDYTNNAYGVAYVHEDETIKLGNSTGWYAGVVYNQFKLKDIGRSKENTTMLKAGIFKTKAFDHNGSLKWTISGEGYVSRSDMDRRFLVVDEIFSAQSDYYTYGVALKNELSKEFRTSERTSITPYGSLKMEYGKFNGIKEDTGEIRLEIESNGYYSIKPELGIEFKYKQPMAVRTSLITTLGLAYETELGKTAEVGNRGRVRFTSADWFGIREEKEDRKGNFKADLNLGIENERVGFTLNLGYDTKGENVRGGIGFRAIY